MSDYYYCVLLLRSCVALPEKDVSSCDEDNSTRSNSTTIMTAPPFAGGKEVVHGILIY